MGARPSPQLRKTEPIYINGISLYRDSPIYVYNIEYGGVRKYTHPEKRLPLSLKQWFGLEKQKTKRKDLQSTVWQTFDRQLDLYAYLKHVHCFLLGDGTLYKQWFPRSF